MQSVKAANGILFQTIILKIPSISTNMSYTRDIHMLRGGGGGGASRVTIDYVSLARRGAPFVFPGMYLTCEPTLSKMK